MTDDLYDDFPPTDPKYAYQNIATGEVLSTSRPTRPPRPKRPNHRPQFSRPHRPSGKPPVIETFEDSDSFGVNSYPATSGGKRNQQVDMCKELPTVLCMIKASNNQNINRFHISSFS